MLRRRDRELHRAEFQLSQAREDLEDTNRGLIALYTELQEAREAEARLAALVQSSDDAIMSMTQDGAIRTWNPGASRLFGYAEAEVIGQRTDILMTAASQIAFDKSLERIRSGDNPMPHDTQWRRADGSIVEVAVNVFALQDVSGNLIGFCAVARDITIQVEVQRQLEWLARFDTLTGLVNRAEIIARLNSALEDLRNPGPHLGLLFCDIDRFKVINDTWGHGVGDLVLTTVADRIRQCVRAKDTVGRMGGDEMLVLLPGLHSLEDAAQIAEKIRCRAAEPIERHEPIVHATLSIGATLAIPGEPVSTMIARADVAMYEAKRAGRNRVTKIAAGRPST